MDTTTRRKIGVPCDVVQPPDGIRLTDPDLAEAMAAGRAYLHDHRDALRELAGWITANTADVRPRPE